MRALALAGGDALWSEDAGRSGLPVRSVTKRALPKTIQVADRAIKDIVRDLHVSRNTVRKVIRSGATAFAYERDVQSLPNFGPWRDDLDRMLATNAGRSGGERLTLIRIYDVKRRLFGRAKLDLLEARLIGIP